MSSSALPGDVSPAEQGQSAEDPVTAVLWKGIELLASLKLTCFLFLLGMFIVLVGSLAQARRDVWLVVGEYFRTYVAWIDVADFFPPSMFPWLVDYDWDGLGALRRIPFPGGWTIGWVMLANLLAAHFLRFRIRVSGAKLAAGVGIIGLGSLLTLAVVWTGNQQTGVESGDTMLSAMQIWYLMLAVLAVASAIPLAVAFLRTGLSRPERILMGVIGVTLGGVLAWFVFGGEDARLNLSSMRILWQLLKGTACAVVILIGCNLLFEKRGGIVLLHMGVALLMFSELQVGFYAKENLLTLKEGEKLSFMRDIRERELAIMRRDGTQDHVVAIPEARLVAAAAEDDPKNKVIDFEGLPFVVRVESFLRNSRLRSKLPGEDKIASAGLGTFAAAVEIDPVTGMDDSHDISSLRVTLLERETGDEIESLLCSQEVSELRAVPIAEQVTVDGEDYQLYLRFQRNYKDYEVELLDVSRTNYVGTATPRDYRSQIVISDKDGSASEEFTLWMNNPLRYNGETFYQSGYQELPDGSEMTTLSVVRNTGWMLPYIACMIVAVGMFAQFGQTLGRYLSRMDRAPARASTPSAASGVVAGLPEGLTAAPVGTSPVDAQPEPSAEKSIWPVVVPVLLVVLSAAWLGSKARPPKEDPNAMNLYGFAQLPVAWKGRPQPIDSFARTELLTISHKSTFEGELTAGELDHAPNRERLIERITRAWPSVKASDFDGFSGEYMDWVERIMKLTSSGQAAVEERVRDVMVQRMPAVRWLLDVVARPELAQRHRVVKIDNDQVLSVLGLEKRSGLAYSIGEIEEKLSELEKAHRDGLKLQMAEQEHRMSQLQRQAVRLFQIVDPQRGRLASLKNMFLYQDTDDLLESVVRAWWVLDELGDRPAIMAVPTGSENEQRSWETLIAAGAMRNVRNAFQAAALNSRDEVLTYVRETLPSKLVSRESVLSSVEGSLQIIHSSLQESKPDEEVTDADVKQRAMETADRIQEPYLQKILTLIGDAEAGASVETITAGLSDGDLRELAIGRMFSDLTQVIDSMEQQEVRTLIMSLQNPEPDEDSAIGRTERLNLKLVGVVLDDLEKRAGHLMFGEAEPFDRGTVAMMGVLDAWSDGDVAGFNTNVNDYRAFLATQSLPHVDATLLSKEAYFHFYEPFMKAIYLYLPVLLMSFFSWLVWPKSLRRSAFWLMALAFLVHSVALYTRMQISGRPPVTNLYSSAIFIGWAVVGASFAIESALKNGIGNILGSAVGMGTLMIAHYLARDEGDTLGVMQAVLDTQFWLATHVVCITLGYAATFLAGAMGMAYVVRSFLAGRSSEDLARLGKMVYGVLCFAVFFSLVGTVLGGLWADDSWGRFWGWDPKENGAMLIVMWNAVILHARWDKMVRDYGTAVLAMFGNIVTAWSWFGVNELKAGLHTYGFTEGRLLALMVFIAIQSIIICGALIPVVGGSANKRVAAEPKVS